MIISKYGKITTHNCSDTVPAGTRLNYQNTCRTNNTIVLIKVYHGQSIKELHHTNVAQIDAIVAFLRSLILFVRILARPL